MSRPNLTTGGWVRVALYVLTVLVALVASLAPALGFVEYEEVLRQLAAVLGVLSGGTAVVNVPKADDQNLRLRDLLPAVGSLAGEVRELREHTPQDVAAEVERRVAPKPTAADDAGLPVYRGSSTAGQ